MMGVIEASGTQKPRKAVPVSGSETKIIPSVRISTI